MEPERRSWELPRHSWCGVWSKKPKYQICTLLTMFQTHRASPEPSFVCVLLSGTSDPKSTKSAIRKQAQKKQPQTYQPCFQNWPNGSENPSKVQYKSTLGSMCKWPRSLCKWPRSLCKWPRSLFGWILPKWSPKEAQHLRQCNCWGTKNAGGRLPQRLICPV